MSELVVRALDGKMFTEDNVDWQQYTANLPQSAAVSENANAIVLQYRETRSAERRKLGTVPAITRQWPQGVPCGHDAPVVNCSSLISR